MGSRGQEIDSILLSGLLFYTGNSLSVLPPLERKKLFLINMKSGKI